MHGQSNIGSMCDCKPCRSLDLLVLVEILSGVDSDHGTGPRRYSSVNSRSTLCQIFIKNADQRRSFKLIWQITFCKEFLAIRRAISLNETFVLFC